MWGQSFELEHSRAAGREAVLVMLAFCIAVTVVSAAFAATLVHGAHRYGEILAKASASG